VPAHLRALIAHPSSRVDAFGIRISGASITGQLDLSNANVPFPLHFMNCAFSDAPVFEGANLQDLHIVSSTFPGLLANGVRVRRDLVQYGSYITGAHITTSSLTRSSAVWLTESIIGGRLLAVGTQIETRQVERFRPIEVELAVMYV
jgi:hypothetical protein